MARKINRLDASRSSEDVTKTAGMQMAAGSIYRSRPTVADAGSFSFAGMASTPRSVWVQHVT